MIGYLKRRIDVCRYRRLRRLQVKLNHEMTKGLSRNNMLEAANEFHMVRNGSIVLDAKDDSAFLIDRLLYDCKTRGRNRIESFYEEDKRSLSRDEKKLLRAMKDSRYSLFVITNVMRGYGARLNDVFNEEELFLFDFNMSRTTTAGNIVSMRVISLDGIRFSSGAGCVFDGEYLERLKINFIDLFEKKRHMMTWDDMMRTYNPYFYKMMKRSDKKMTFSFI